jgi:hypothetical protein
MGHAPSAALPRALRLPAASSLENQKSGMYFGHSHPSCRVEALWQKGLQISQGWPTQIPENPCLEVCTRPLKPCSRVVSLVT